VSQWWGEQQIGLEQDRQTFQQTQVLQPAEIAKIETVAAEKTVAENAAEKDEIASVVDAEARRYLLPLRLQKVMMRQLHLRSNYENQHLR
jgi:hypothetical protein